MKVEGGKAGDSGEPIQRERRAEVLLEVEEHLVDALSMILHRAGARGHAYFHVRWRSIAHQWAAGFSNLADLGLATLGLNPRFQTIPAAVLALARQGKPAGS